MTMSMHFIKALEALSRSLEISPQTVTYKELGRLYLKKGDLVKAVEIYRKAAK